VNLPEGGGQMLRYIRQLSAVFILLTCAPLARDQQTDRRDGNWWADRDESFKMAYFVGFFDGMDLGNKFSYWAFADNKNYETMRKVGDSYKGYQDKYMIHVTNIQLTQGVDKLYTDVRNRKIRVRNAVWLVVNQIAGKSDAEMEKMIENFRKDADKD
jgi:hypothetical protein